MDFKIKQNSELPILELKPYRGKNYSELLQIIENATVTFSMYDDKDCFKILNKSAIIEFNTKDNNYHSLEDTTRNGDDFRLQYKFTKKDTNKSGIFTGLFKINFDGKEFPITVMINIISSNVK